MRVLFGWMCVAGLVLGGCASDGDDSNDGRGSAGDGDGSAGSGTGAGDSNLEFGNSDATQPPPPASNLAISAGGDCKAGHYVGTLGGMYRTPVLFELSQDFETEDVADLAGGPDTPGFEFWLVASEGVAECSEDQEFCFDFKVEGGLAKGMAAGTVPFEMQLVGELDCGAGAFVGELQNGKYIFLGLEYFYEGTIEASFDSANDQFFDGTWAVSEPISVMAGGNAGGDGEWYAGWVMN